MADLAATLAEVFREERGQVVATLIRMTGDWDLAEECTQEALAKALEHWPSDGVPRKPGAWLTTTARNHALNRLRRKQTESVKLREVATLAHLTEHDEADQSGIDDDRLRLIFTCCHPALPLDGRVALTLRTLTGLTTTEIAHAFLVSEATMSQRLVRTKRKIRDAGIPYRVPPPHLLPERVNGVLGVLYLLFNEGYAATSGEHPTRHELCAEAVYLTRTLARLMPGEAEILGLLALMLLQDSRRSARLDDTGELVLLEDQDRARWDRAAIDEGVELLDLAMKLEAPGPYQIQAAIAACHATAPTSAETDWPQIAALYTGLVRLVPSAVVELNRAVAVAMADGPEAGLVLVDALTASGRLDGYHLLPATRAELLRRLDRHAEAADGFRQALDLARNTAERGHLTRRLDEVTGALTASEGHHEGL